MAWADLFQVIDCVVLCLLLLVSGTYVGVCVRWGGLAMLTLVVWLLLIIGCGLDGLRVWLLRLWFWWVLAGG